MRLLQTLQLSLVFTLLLISSTLYGQQYLEMIRNADETTSFDSIVSAAENYFKDRDKGRGSGYKQFKRWEEKMRFRLADDGTMINYNAQIWEESRKAGRLPAMLPSNPSTPGQPPAGSGGGCMGDLWKELGPKNYINGNQGYNPGLGRVNVIAFDPVDSNVFYLGAPAGSLWKTTDGGTTWTPLTDGLASIGVSGIAFHPNNPNNIFILTGDGDGADTYSIGVLESNDGGQTWSSTGLSFNRTQLKRGYKLLMHPSNPDIMFVAMADGIYRTLDGGNNWLNVLSGNFRDIEFNPGNSSIVYASTINSFLRSVNDGSTWTNISTGLPGTTNRIEIGVSPADPSLVYLLSGPDQGNGQFTGISRSTNEGQTFSVVTTTPNILGYSPTGDDASSQSWYDLAVAVNPNDASTVITGGINVWKSTDSANSLSVRSYWISPSNYEYTHADIHELVYNPLNEKLYCGSDGGIFVSSDHGDTWTDLSDGIVITQFYEIAISEKDTNLIIGGTQDNGSNQWYGNDTIIHMYGADGMDCMIDFNNPDTMYYSTQGGGLRRSYDGGNTSTYIAPSSGPWVTPYAMNPKSPNNIFGGWGDLFRSFDRGETWTNFGMPCNRDIEIYPNDPDIIYTGHGNNCFRSDDRGKTYENISSGLPGKSIASITVNPDNPDEVWICYGGFNSTQKVFKTTSGGGIWENVSAGLPNVPMNSIKYVDNDENGAISGGIYVGTDIGVWYREDSLDWTCVSNGLPNVPVSDIEINYSNKKVRIGTYGRGLWETSLITAVDANCQEATVYLNSDGNAVLSIDSINNGSTAPGGIDSMWLCRDTLDCSDFPATYVTLIVRDNIGEIDSCQSLIAVEDTIAPVAKTKLHTAYLDSNGKVSITAEDVNNGSADNCSIDTMFVNPASFDCTDGDTVNTVFTIIDIAGNLTSGQAQVILKDTVKPWLHCIDTTLYLNANGIATLGRQDLIKRTTGTDTLHFVGKKQRWVVPDRVDSITIELFGAQGGDGAQGAVGGKGGWISAQVSVETGDSLFFYIGGQGSSCFSCPEGGFNGGGGTQLVNHVHRAGTGGGATDVRLGDTLLSARILVAGAGGGGGFLSTEANGGAGGGLIGEDGYAWDNYNPGRGGTQTTGGLGGSGAAWNQPDAENGSLGKGGRGRGTIGGGGGGGAGYFGGGGGFVAGGGGGSSFAKPNAVNTQHLQGVHEGNGLAVIHWQTRGEFGDNCGVDSIFISKSTFLPSDTGTNNVTTTATDKAGNQTECLSLVTVKDTLPPVVNCKEIDLYLDVNGNAELTAADIDNGTTDFSGIDSLWLSNYQFSCANSGTNYVMFYASDVFGNMDSCKAIVHIRDTIAPAVVATLDTFYLDSNGHLLITPEMVYDSAFDACGIAEESISKDSFNCENVGTNKLNLTLTDSSGNQRVKEVEIVVLDTVKPVAKCSKIEFYLETGESISLTTDLINDGSFDACELDSMSLDKTSFTCSDVGMQEVTLTVWDVNGNKNLCVAEIIVNDTISPVIKCQPITVFLDSTGTQSIWSKTTLIDGITDNCAIQNINFSQDTFYCDDLGTQSLTITATDSNGNQNVCSTTLEVLDTIAPEMNCKDTTVYLSQDGTMNLEPGHFDDGIADACGIMDLSVSEAMVRCSDIGNLTVTIQATDSAGNMAQCTVTALVEDTVAPQAICKSSTVYLSKDGTAEISAENIGENSTDACGIESYSLSQSNFNCDHIGSKNVMLTVTDSNGNTAECQSSISVQDTLSPTTVCRDTTISLNENGEAFISPEMLLDTMYDECGIDSSWVNPEMFTESDLGFNDVEVSVMDINGNRAVCNSTVEVLPYSTGLADYGLNKAIKLYPNPTENEIILEINLDREENIRWEVRDLLGRKIQSGNEGKRATLKRVIDLRETVAGSYLVKLFLGDEVITRKILRIK